MHDREYSVAVQRVPDHKVFELGVVIVIGMVVRNRPVVRSIRSEIGQDEFPGLGFMVDLQEGCICTDQGWH